MFLGGSSNKKAPDAGGLGERAAQRLSHISMIIPARPTGRAGTPHARGMTRPGLDSGRDVSGQPAVRSR